jgi:hypothetical protein
MSRHPKSSVDLAKPRRKRERYDRVLIVLEDSKSSYDYLGILCKSFKISSANIDIVPANLRNTDERHGNDPVSVIDYAIKRYKKDKKENKQDFYNSVFCVIDRDIHPKYSDALIKARDTQSIKLCIVTSIPCFEYWLLLHFIYTVKPFSSTEKHSKCDQAKNELSYYIKDYNKGNISENIYEVFLKQKQYDAICRAYKATLYHEMDEYSDWNSSTQMHILVEYLSSIKSDKPKKVTCRIVGNKSEIVSILSFENKN